MKNSNTSLTRMHLSLNGTFLLKLHSSQSCVGKCFSPKEQSLSNRFQFQCLRVVIIKHLFFIAIRVIDKFYFFPLKVTVDVVFVLINLWQKYWSRKILLNNTHNSKQLTLLISNQKEIYLTSDTPCTMQPAISLNEKISR